MPYPNRVQIHLRLTVFSQNEYKIGVLTNTLCCDYNVYVVKVLIKAFDMKHMRLLYTPSETKQILAQTFFIQHEKGTPYTQLAREYKLHVNYVMQLAHWYRDYGRK